MSNIGAAILGNSAQTYVYSTGSPTKNTGSGFGIASAQKESVVDKFKQRHPDRARHVEQQVKAGRAVKSKNGADDISTENMTMEEYKAYFNALLDTIPYDFTRKNDTSIISISEKGWEQMKQDPDYEAWILGYFVEDRAVRNPFFGWGGNDGIFCIEHFGASIEEHNGQGFSKSLLSDSKEDDDEKDIDSWWIKRHKRIHQLLQEQAAEAAAKNRAKRAEAREEYARLQHASLQRQHHFLNTGLSEKNPVPATKASLHMAAAVYDSALPFTGGDIMSETPPPIS